MINNSTGGGINGDMVRQGANGVREIMWEERLKGMEAGAEMCTLDPTTIFASFEGRGNPHEHVALALRGALAEAMRQQRASSRNGRCSAPTTSAAGRDDAHPGRPR